MGILGWVAGHWFDILQTASILAGFFTAAYTIRTNTKERKIGNLFALKLARALLSLARVGRQWRQRRELLIDGRFQLVVQIFKTFSLDMGQGLLRRAAEMANLAGEHRRAAALIRQAIGQPGARREPTSTGLLWERLGRFLWAAGDSETALQAYNMIRKGGTAVMVGMTRAEAQVTLPTFDLFFNEKTLKGSKYGSGQVRRDFQRFIDLIETGRLDTSTMVSRTIKLDDVNDAFRAMEAGEVIRSVITSF